MSRKALAAFLLPAGVLYTLFVIYPLVQAAGYSVFEWTGVERGSFVWLANYERLFGGRLGGQVLSALGHNVMFFLGTMLVQNTLGLAFAYLLSRGPRGKRFFQIAIGTPYLVSPLVVGYVWSMLLNPTFGPINALLRSMGLGHLALPWLGDPQLALPVVILVNAWQWVGFPMLIFAAGIAGIPEDYDSAARLDGANSRQIFWRITAPLLLPSIGIVTVLTFVGTFNAFGLIYAMQGSTGSPAGSTDVLGLLFYRLAFANTDPNAIGVSSALAVLMFALIFGLATIAINFFRRRESRLT